MRHRAFFWFILPSLSAMFLLIALPLFSVFLQSLYVEHEQILKTTKNCTPFGCKEEITVDFDANQALQKQAPMGQFNGLKTYTNRNHLAFAEVTVAWQNTGELGEFFKSLLNLSLIHISEPTRPY